ncbi:unnamed protein product, partial [Brachionus calyciflorus]
MNQEQIHLSTNRNNLSCRWKNYLFNLKTKGKMSAAFVCNTSGCYASVSLRVVKFEIIEPFEITYQNENHKVDYRPIQQIYEETKAVHRTVSETTLPDYVEVKSGLKKVKAKVVKTPQYSSIEQIQIRDKFTSNGKDIFYFFDNHKKNRSFGFASQTGLKCLSESQFYHADGTFHTKTRYMALIPLSSVDGECIRLQY